MPTQNRTFAFVDRTFYERSSDDHNVHDLEANVHLVITHDRSRSFTYERSMNVQHKIVNVMIVGRTFTERSSYDHNGRDLVLNVRLVIVHDRSRAHVSVPER